MTWTKVGDDYPDRPSLLAVSRLARHLHLEGQVYCNRHLTDGHLQRTVLRRLGDSDDPEGEAAELERAGLWVAVDDLAWHIDMTDQEPAEMVRHRKATNAERQRRYQRHLAGDHEACSPGRCAGAKALLRAVQPSRVTNALVTPSLTPSHPPLPSPPPGPARRKQGQGGQQQPAHCPNGFPVVSDGSCCGNAHREIS